MHEATVGKAYLEFDEDFARVNIPTPPFTDLVIANGVFSDVYTDANPRVVPWSEERKARWREQYSKWRQVEPTLRAIERFTGRRVRGGLAGWALARLDVPTAEPPIRTKLVTGCQFHGAYYPGLTV